MVWLAISNLLLVLVLANVYWHRRPASHPAADMCQCSHAAAFHDQDGCRASVRVLVRETARRVLLNCKDHIVYDREWSSGPCSCAGYVGPHTVPELDLAHRLRPELTD